MSISSVFLRGFLLSFLALSLIGCGRGERAQNAREFVQKYSGAWQRGDVDAILSLHYDLKKFDTSKIPEGEKVTLAQYNLQDHRREVEDDLARKGLGYHLGTEMRYVSEEDHGDYVRVHVEVLSIPTEIVLFKDEDLLKLFPFPSWFK